MDRYRKAQARIEIKHNQMMLHEIIEGLNDIVLAQIHHRLCQHPPPEIKDFLDKITQKSPKRFNLAEGLPLPQSSGALEHQPVDLENGKFLFPDVIDSDVQNAADIKKKEKMIKNLLEKYDRMSSKCKIKVEAVRNYLMEHYKMLHDLNKSKNSSEAQEESDLLANETTTLAPGNVEGNLSQNVKDMNQNNLPSADLNKAENVEKNDGGNGESPANILTSKNLIGNPLEKNNQINNNGNLQPIKNLRNVAENNKLNDMSEFKVDLETLIPGKRKGFLTSSELNKYVEDAMRRQNEDVDDDDNDLVKRETKLNKTNWNVSDKYKKLIETATKVRLKRKTEEKLGKLFGEKLNKPIYDNDIKDYSQIKFESPVVYSLDH